MSKALHYIDGHWVEGNPPIIGPMTHAGWMSSVVFDGARAFEGVTPDLDLHCERLVRSAHSMGLKPLLSGPEIMEIALDGIGRFPNGTELYIRPMYYAEDGFVVADPDSTRFVLTLFEVPMDAPARYSACLSTRRRPAPDMAPTDAKAACLYPNVGRALREAAERGFDSAVILDGLGNVAEFATANLFFAKDDVVHTPVANGTFLDGITRQRVIKLLLAAGQPVIERSITFPELLEADEVFSTGNKSKLAPVTRIEDRDFQPGPIYARARELYWAFAHGKTL
jgi:branched-chain amino acid aminotransferase